jgi:hypothetical protein
VKSKRTKPGTRLGFLSRSQILLADCIVLGQSDEGVTGTYEKPVAGPGLKTSDEQEACRAAMCWGSTP